MTWTKDNGRVAKQNADYAKQQGDNAKDQADYAKTQGNFAKNEASNLSQLKTDVTKATNEAEIQAKYAKEQGDFAKKQGDYAKAEADKIKDLDDAKFNQRLVDVEDQVKDTERQTQKLQHGVNVLNGTAVSPVDIEIYGRTLVNLIYDISPFSITLDPNKYYLIISETNAQVDVNGNLQNTPYKFTGRADVQITWSPGNVALYEIQKNDYDKILVDWDSVKVNNLYPYVKVVQHLTNPYVQASGLNLLDGFISSSSTSYSQTSPYCLDLKSTVVNGNMFFTVEVIPNTEYVLSCEMGDDSRFAIFRNDGINAISTFGTSPKTFNTGNSNIIRIYFRNNKISTETFSNWILSLGSTPKPFVPRDPSYLFTDVKLGQIGTVKDMLYKQDGQWLVRESIKKNFILDGSLVWGSVDKVGYKLIYVAINDALGSQNPVSIKFNGKILKQNILVDKADEIYITSGKNLNLTVSDTDSGWSESRTPTLEEIKAYFNGWQVKTSDGSGKPTAWKSIINGSDSPTQTLDYVSKNQAPNYTPYKLSYSLAKPEIINVNDKVEGDIVLNGLTQVDVGSGVINREEVTPKLDGSSYYIMDKDSSSFWGTSRVKHNVKNYLNVYKNGEIDPMWYSISPTGMKIDDKYFDSTAIYSTTYLMKNNNEFTANVTDLKLTYSNNIRSALDDVVIKQSDIATTVSVNVRSIAELYKRVRLLEGV